MRTRCEKRQADADPVRLIVMEHGSRWPSWARESVADAIVLAQQPGENGLAFARRVVRRLGVLEDGQRLEGAVVAVSDDTTREASLARALIVQGALRCMSSVDPGEVVLVADEAAADATRNELFALVGAVCERARAPGAVSIRFGRRSASLGERRFRDVVDTTAQVISP